MGTVLYSIQPSKSMFTSNLRYMIPCTSFSSTVHDISAIDKKTKQKKGLWMASVCSLGWPLVRNVINAYF